LNLEERLSRVETSQAVMGRDQSSLRAELHGTANELRNQDTEEQNQRMDLERTWRVLLSDAVEASASARTALANGLKKDLENMKEVLVKRQDLQRDTSSKLDDRVRGNHAELSSTLAALKAKTERDVQNAVLASKDATDRASHEARAHASGCHARVEALLHGKVADIQAEMHQAIERAGAEGLKVTEARLADIVNQISERLEEGRAHTDCVREDHTRSLQDTSSQFHHSLKEARSTLGTDIEKLGGRLTETESRVALLVSELEISVLHTAEKRADTAVARLQRELAAAKSSLGSRIDDLQQESFEQSRRTKDHEDQARKTLRQECDAALNQTTHQLAVKLRGEFEAGFHDLGIKMDGFQASDSERNLRLDVIADRAHLSACGNVETAGKHSEIPAGDARAQVSQIGDLWAYCIKREKQATSTRQRFQKEILQLGGELTQLRAASSGLTQGVLEALRIIGILDEPEVHQKSPNNRKQRTQVQNIEDLLEWEKDGKPLAGRIKDCWTGRNTANSCNLL